MSSQWRQIPSRGTQPVGDDIKSDETQIAALREEIRQTARVMAELHRRQLRPRVVWVGAGVVVVGSLVALMVRHPDYLVLLVFAHALTIPLLLGIAGAVVFADGIAKIAAQRRARQEQLVERLHSLPGDELAATLLPLRSDAEPGVRALAKRLLREVDLRTELAPAPAPGARGDEPCPAEGMG